MLEKTVIFLRLALITCFLAVLPGCSQTDHVNPDYVKIDATHFGPSEDERGDFYYEIKNIEILDESIFLSTDMTGLIELDRDGNKIREYAERGRGPAYVRSVVGSVVTPDLVWILGGRARLHCYERGTGDHLYSLTLDISKGRFHSIYTSSVASNPLIYRDNHLLVPVYTEGDIRNIALLVNEQGEIVKPIRDPDYREIHERELQGWRRTIWVYDGGYWYCAYMYRHRLLKFDEEFNKVYDVEIDNFATRRFDDWASNATMITPFYWDMDHSSSSIFLLAQDGVDQVDKDTGAFIRKIRFMYLRDKMHKGKLYRDVPITFTTFGLRDDGSVILAPSIPRELQDNLFQANLYDKLKRSDL